jgi:activator of HSP90 ATPase
MAKTLQQSVRFDAPPERVYALYADPRLHSASTGGAARFVPKPGAAFAAWMPHLLGRLLVLEKPRLIVQTWRGDYWKAGEPDSVLVLTFTRAGKGTLLRMVHSNIPDAYVASIRSGWRSHYWTPWKKYLRQHG